MGLRIQDNKKRENILTMIVLRILKTTDKKMILKAIPIIYLLNLIKKINFNQVTKSNHQPKIMKMINNKNLKHKVMDQVILIQIKIIQ